MNSDNKETRFRFSGEMIFTDEIPKNLTDIFGYDFEEMKEISDMIDNYLYEELAGTGTYASEVMRALIERFYKPNDDRYNFALLLLVFLTVTNLNGSEKI